jgi:hypothetical protein
VNRAASLHAGARQATNAAPRSRSSHGGRVKGRDRARLAEEQAAGRRAEKPETGAGTRALDRGKTEEDPKENTKREGNAMSKDARLAELILYISDRCQLDPTFGATKLNKILFYADFQHYASRGVPITGQEYMRLANGPVPRRLLPVRDELVQRHELVVRSVPYAGWQQKRTIALRDADLSGFNGDEIATVDSVINALWGKTAMEVSNLSHLFDGWKLAEDRETIPYEAALISEREPDEEDYEFAHEAFEAYRAGV